MALTLSGRLYDPFGNALENAGVRFRAARTSTQVLANYQAETTTDSSGDYAITVQYATYHIEARQSASDPWYTIARSIPVTTETTSTDINALIVAYVGAGDATPEIVLEIEAVAAQATAAQSAAESAAETAVSTLSSRPFWAGTSESVGQIDTSLASERQLADLTDELRHGGFIWSPSDRSSEVSADPLRGIFIPPTSDLTGASGAWMRQYSMWDGVSADWFGDGDGAIQAAIDYVSSKTYKGIVNLSEKQYSHSGLTITSNNIHLRGTGIRSTQLSYTGTGKAIQLGTGTASVFFCHLSGFSMEDVGGGEYGIYLGYARESTFENILINSGCSIDAVHLAGTETEGCWSNRFTNVWVKNTLGNGFRLVNQSNANMFFGIRTSLVGGDGFQSNRSNGCKIIGGQFEQAGSGNEINLVSDGVLSGRTLGLQVSGCYFELKKQNASSRAVRHSGNAALSNFVQEIDISGCTVWGTEAATYAFEFDSSTVGSTATGTGSGNFVHGVTTAAFRATAGGDRLLVSGTYARSEFGGGLALPLLDNNGTTGGSSSLIAGFRGMQLDTQLRLGQYAASPASSLGDGSVWWSTNLSMMLMRRGTDNLRVQTNDNGASRPSSPATGQQFFDTSLGHPIWWSGSSWVDATGSSV